MNSDIKEDNHKNENIWDEDISKLSIDSRSYFFKLSENQSFDYLSRLAKLVEIKILSNKKKFHLKDYEKLLILTSLNLAEDIFKLRKQIENLSQGKTASNDSNLPSNLEIIERLEHLKNTLEEVEPPKDNHKAGEEK